MESVSTAAGTAEMPSALALLSSKRPRNVGPVQAGALLFGDWGTSRLYVLGLAFFFAGPSSFWLIAAMSLLILAVGWAYAQICRIYPDGGGVYAAARSRSKMLAVVGALLLFADYVITASLSALDAFHYFNLGHTESFFALNSPGLWAVVSIVAIGVFNFLGPKHTSGFAIFAAIGMIFITVVVVILAVPQVPWGTWSSSVPLPHESIRTEWIHFVSIVLALSGVEAIASMAGVLKKPVGRTAGRSIAFVALEVAIFNVVLAAIMVFAMQGVDDSGAHRDDMLAFLTGKYGGPIVEWCVRIVGGVLLLSAANTAIGGMIAVLYILARDGELPSPLQKLNSFGVPVIPAVMALSVPAIVLILVHDVEQLSHLYAIGVIGAVAINVALCAIHPRLYHWWRKVPMAILGVLLLAIWVTLASTKHEALLFVSIVLVLGLIARAITQRVRESAGEKPSLIRQAIQELFKPEVHNMPKMLLGTYGSDTLAEPALNLARARGAALIVCFIRELQLDYRYDSQQNRLTIDTDPAAMRTFTRFLELGHEKGVPVIPAYDTGNDAAALMGETAAMYGCDRVLIGSSRQGAVHRAVKGSFQQRVESILPSEIKVEVLTPTRSA
jgi:amino acid transporter